MNCIPLFYNFISCTVTPISESNINTNIDKAYYCYIREVVTEGNYMCVVNDYFGERIEQRYNSCLEIPLDEIAKKHVRSLSIRDWDIKTFPRDVFRFTHLVYLSISWSAFEEIPSEIGTLTSLKTLKLVDNKVENLPPEIGSLHQLKVLDISHNRIKDLPDEFSSFKRLEYLHASNTSIKQVPIIQSLVRIDLSNNGITEFPESVLCPSLQYINLSNNSIKYIKSSVLDKLEKYRPSFKLDLRSNSSIGLHSNGDKCGLIEIVGRLGSRVLYDTPMLDNIKQIQSESWSYDKNARSRSFKDKAFCFKYQNALQWKKGKGKQIVMHLRRDDVLEGTLRYFANYDPSRDLSHAIKINYVDEIGDDLGGLFKDWLDNVSKSFMSKEKKLFKMASTDEKFGMCPVKITERLSDEDMLPYVVLGRIISLAILRNCPLRLCLHWSVYMYLTDTQPTLEGIKHFDDELYKQLQESLQSTDQDSEFNVVTATECKRIKVETEAIDKNLFETNEHNIVDVDSYLYELYEGYIDGIVPQLESIKKGMNDMLKYKILHVFHPHELELLVCGQAKVDIKVWKKNAIYKNMNSDDDVIKWFWEVIGSWDDKKVTALYKFITGLSRVSFSGAETLTIVKQHKVDKDRFPYAYTCCNKLYLSDYSTKEKFAEILEETVLNSDVGFYMY